MNHLIEQALKFLRSRSGHHWALVMLDGAVRAAKWDNLDKQLSEGHMLETLVAETRRGRVPILVTRAQSPRFSRCRDRDEPPFESAISIPVLDADDGSCRGVLLAANPRPSAFSHYDLSAGRTLAARLARQLAAPVTTGSEPPAQPAIRRPVALGACSLLLTFGAIFSPFQQAESKAAPPPPPPKPAGILQPESAGPEVVARSFLRLIELGEKEQAYGLLSEPLRARYPAAHFESGLAAWTQDEVRRWAFPRRRVRLVQTGAQAAAVEFVPAAKSRDGEIWSCRLVKGQNGRWQIGMLEGGPFRLP